MSFNPSSSSSNTVSLIDTTLDYTDNRAIINHSSHLRSYKNITEYLPGHPNRTTTHAPSSSTTTTETMNFQMLCDATKVVEQTSTKNISVTSDMVDNRSYKTRINSSTAKTNQTNLFNQRISERQSNLSLSCTCFYCLFLF